MFVHRALQLASGERLPLQDVPSAEALSESGYLLVESSKDEEILDEVFFLSGEIPRTSFKRGMGNQVRLIHPVTGNQIRSSWMSASCWLTLEERAS